MSKLKKRDNERKGEKKKKMLESKLLEENLPDLTGPTAELEELHEEDF